MSRNRWAACDQDDGLRSSTVLFVYLGAGPPAGAVCAWLGTLFWGILTRGPFALRWQQGMEILIFAAIVSYAYAGLYAAVTGLLVALWHRIYGVIPFYVAILAPLAAVYPASLVQLRYEVGTGLRYELALAPSDDILFLAAIGVAASVVCWLLLRHRLWPFAWRTEA